MKNRIAAAITVCLAICWSVCTTRSFADTVDLRAGVRVDGKIVRKSENGTKDHLIIQVDPELQIAIPLTRVTRAVSEDDEDLVWYQQQLQTVPDEAEAQYALARECKKRRLSAQCDYHFRRAIEIDPNHSRSRRALGYVEDGNGWILYEDQQRQRGMIRTSGGWAIPEVYARDQRRDEANEAALIWKKNFAKMRTTALRPGKNAEESLEAIKAIDDPLASLALADALEKSRGNDLDPQWLRKIYVKKLGSFRTPLAVRALVETGLAEPDTAIRTEALLQLQEFGGRSAVASYLPILTSEKHTRGEVTAALRALNYFPDQELWREYVDALITEHKTIKPAGPGMSVGRNSLGGSGMTTGGKQEVITDYVQNRGALALLKQIAPDVDFRYDQAAWRGYFADQLMGSVSELRRDP